MKMVFSSFLQTFFFYLYILEQKLNALSFVFKPWRIIEFTFVDFLVLRRTITGCNSYFNQILSPALEYIDIFTLMQGPQEIFIIVISGFSLIFTVVLFVTKTWKESVKNTAIKCYLMVFVALRLLLFPIVAQLYFLITSPTQKYPMIREFRFLIFFPVLKLLAHIIVESNKRSVYGVFQWMIPLLYLADTSDITLFICLIIFSIYYLVKRAEHPLKIFADTTLISVIFAVLCRLGKSVGYAGLLIYVFVMFLYIFNYFQGVQMLTFNDKMIEIQYYSRRIYKTKQVRQDSKDEFLVQTILLQQFMYYNVQNQFLQKLNKSPVVTWKPGDYLKLLESQTSINMHLSGTKLSKILNYKSQLQNQSLHYTSLTALEKQFKHFSMDINYKYDIYVLMKQLQMYYQKFKTEEQFINTSVDLDNQISHFYKQTLSAFESLAKVWKYLSLETVHFEKVEPEYIKMEQHKASAAKIFNSMAEKCKLGIQFSHMLKMTTILNIDPTEEKKIQITNKLKLEDHFPFIIVNNGKIKYSSFKFNKLFNYNPVQLIGSSLNTILPPSFRNNFFKQKYPSTLLISEEKVLILDGSNHLVFVDINVYLDPSFINELDYVICFLRTNLDGKLLFLYLPESDEVECVSSSFQKFYGEEKDLGLFGKQLFDEIDLTNEMTLKSLNTGAKCLMKNFEQQKENSTSIKLQKVQQFKVKNRQRLLIQMITQQNAQSPTKIRTKSSELIQSLSSRIMVLDQLKQDCVDQSDTTVDAYLNQLLEKKQSLNQQHSSHSRSTILALSLTTYSIIIISALFVMMSLFKVGSTLIQIGNLFNSIAMMNYSIVNLLFKSFTMYHIKYFPPPSTAVYFQYLLNYTTASLDISIYEFQKYYLTGFNDLYTGSSKIQLSFTGYSSVFCRNETYLINMVYQATINTQQSIQFLINNFGTINGIKDKLTMSSELYEQISCWINWGMIVITITSVIVAIFIMLNFVFVVKLENMIKDVGRLFTFVLNTDIDKEIVSINNQMENCEKIYKKQLQESPYRESFGSLRKLLKRNTEKRITLHRNSIAFSPDLLPKARKIKYSNRHYYWELGKLTFMLLIGAGIIAFWIPQLITIKKTIKNIVQFQKSYYASVIDTKNHLLQVYQHVLNNETSPMNITDNYINTLLLREDLLPPEYFNKVEIWKLLNQNLCKTDLIKNHIGYHQKCQQIFHGALQSGLSKSINRFIINLNRLSRLSLQSENIILIDIFQQLKLAQMFILNGIGIITAEINDSFNHYIHHIYFTAYTFVGAIIMISVIYPGYTWITYYALLKRRELCKSLFNLIPNDNFLFFHLKKFMQEKDVMNRMLLL